MKNKQVNCLGFIGHVWVCSCAYPRLTPDLVSSCVHEVSLLSKEDGLWGHKAGVRGGADQKNRYVHNCPDTRSRVSVCTLCPRPWVPLPGANVTPAQWHSNTFSHPVEWGLPVCSSSREFWLLLALCMARLSLASVGQIVVWLELHSACRSVGRVSVWCRILPVYEHGTALPLLRPSFTLLNNALFLFSKQKKKFVDISV